MDARGPPYQITEQSGRRYQSTSHLSYHYPKSKTATSQARRGLLAQLACILCQAQQDLKVRLDGRVPQRHIHARIRS